MLADDAQMSAEGELPGDLAALSRRRYRRSRHRARPARIWPGWCPSWPVWTLILVLRRRPGLVRGLVYPVPDPRFPFLGVHLTRMVDGTLHAGPNAVLALRREGYRWRDVSFAEVRALVGDQRVRRLARQHWRMGAAEMWRSASKAAFVRSVARLVPAVTTADLTRAGVRAQAVLPDGALVDDFLIEETERSVHVLNAPSPAVAASLRTGIWEGPRSRTIRSSTSYAVMRRIFARLRRGVSDDQL